VGDQFSGLLGQALMRKNKSPYIQNSGEWPACGWKIYGKFYEQYETRENIFIPRNRGNKQWANAPKVTSMKQLRGGIFHGRK
jgi:hypothetical protein